jgi:PAS domain S-box-containing protein
MSERPRITILHIDDTEANRYVVSRMLQGAGFQVVEAVTGTEGLQAIAQQQPDLIILDVKLPDIDGFEICRRVKSNPATATIPLLFLSAYFVKTEDKAYGLETGADAYLVQPVEGIELVATIKALWRMRQAEESALQGAREWQTTFDAMNDGVCIFNQSGQILRCNSSLMEILHQPDGQLIGQSHQAIMQMLSVSGDVSLFASARETLHRQSRETQSQQRWFLLTLDPIFDEQKTFTGAVFIVRDITQRKLAEAERTQLLEREKAARTEAEAANRLKDEFLATLSHELRSPLNSMLGWARLLNSQTLDSVTTARAMETIENNARVQAQLVEDLLDVSQIIRGQLRLNVRPLELGSLIIAALEAIRPAAQAKEIQISTSLEGAGEVVSGDTERLQQVFWNLFSNAVKFTPKGGSIEVRLEKIDARVEVVVSDTGQGIEADFLPYVFDRFRQADGSITRAHGGLGLGLAIVRYLVEMHGGTVQAESPGEGQGATFTVKLPLLKDNQDVGTEAHRSREEDNSTGFFPQLGGARVLVVDNEEDQRDFLELALQQYGAVVMVVASAAEALEEIPQWHPDVLVSDIGMPGEDGYSLIQKVRKLSADNGGNIPAIALSGYASREDEIKAIASGFQLYKFKPIDPDELAMAIFNLKD